MRSVARKPERRRSSYLLLTDFERLEEWCRNVRIVFDGNHPYMVGSVHDSPDFRDVDLRLMVEDAVYDVVYADPVKVRLVNRAISTWGQRETGLPIDFQVQRMTEANEAYGKDYRNPMGIRDWSLQVPSGHPGGRRHAETSDEPKRRGTRGPRK